MPVINEKYTNFKDAKEAALKAINDESVELKKLDLRQNKNSYKLIVHTFDRKEETK